MTELGQLLYSIGVPHDLVDIDGRTLRRIVVCHCRECPCTSIRCADPRATAVDEEVADPDRGLDVVVALIPAVGGDPVPVEAIAADVVSVVIIALRNKVAGSVRAATNLVT